MKNNGISRLWLEALAAGGSAWQCQVCWRIRAVCPRDGRL